MHLRLPIFPGGGEAWGGSVQDEISKRAGWRHAGVPGSSVVGQDNCGQPSGEGRIDSAPAESDESAIKPDPKAADWIRRYISYHSP